MIYKCNAKKSAVVIYRSMTLKGCTIPNFKLNGIILHVVASYKCLVHYITLNVSCVVYYTLIVDRTNDIILFVSNCMQCWMVILLLDGPQIVMYYILLSLE